MPTYEYECTACAHHFDAVQKMLDPPIRRCPQCGGPVCRILSGGIGIAFHGSGFYATDARKKEATEKAPEKKPAPACPAGCPHCPAAEKESA
ncbi:MAG: zinc ribbon domain-containing protein [Spirochaetaceae bacterium]|jgi:putative FmdB family regulatory protein|nr:zinc ribbon domain-containing protein [Spirochaetaceae bacterium]